MSGYTTSIVQMMHLCKKNNHPLQLILVQKIVKKIIENLKILKNHILIKKLEIFLLSLSTEDFFKHYAYRKPYEEIPLLTSDGIVIPEIGLKSALSNKNIVNIVPTIAGSNKDEVKLWLATAEYFVELDFSAVGKDFGYSKS